MLEKPTIGLACTVLALLLLGGVAGGGGTDVADASSRCGSLSIRFEGGGTHRYAVRVTRGKVTCRRARRVMRRFIARSVTTPDWTCFRGHRGDRWAAACASTRRPTRIIRAYEQK